MRKIHTPLTGNSHQALKAGEQVLLSGIIYTARDRAHQELTRAIKKKKRLPVSLANQVIYYCGPTPAPGKRAIGACGPTTRSRMDDFTPDLLKIGLKGMIGKGTRNKKVKQAIKKYRAVYFLTLAGAGALLSRKITKSEVIAYEELGPEAVLRIEVKDFPVTVINDSYGGDLYIEGKKKHQVE